MTSTDKLSKNSPLYIAFTLRIPGLHQCILYMAVNIRFYYVQNLNNVVFISRHVPNPLLSKHAGPEMINKEISGSRD